MSKKKQQQLWLLVILVATGAWHLWALLVDQQPTHGPDSALLHLLSLLQDLERGLGQFDPHRREGHGLAMLLQFGVKGPVPTLLALPLVPLIGNAVLAMRLVSALAHVGLVAQCHWLGRRLLPGTTAGLWAALICAVTPGIYGWARLEYREVVLALLVTGCLQLMLRSGLRRAAPAALLGLLLGLGLMTKIAFAAFLVAPAIWLVGYRVRGLRQAALVLLSGAVMLLLAGPWAALNWSEIVINFVGSTTTSRFSMADKIVIYLSMPGTGPLLLGALLSAAALWLRRPATRAPQLLLLWFVVLSLGLFLLLFDDWTRYIVPVFPAAAALAGAGLALALGWLPRSAGRALGPAAALALVVWFGWINSTSAEQPNRERNNGMLAPDRRPYPGLPRALGALQRAGQELLLVFDSAEAHEQTQDLEVDWLLWRRRGFRLQRKDLAWATRRLAAGSRVPVLLVRRHRDWRRGVALDRRWTHLYYDPAVKHLRRRLAWLDPLTRATPPLLSTTDPDGLTYEVFLLGPR